MWLRKKPPPWGRPAPPAVVTLAAVAFVRNSIERPRPHGWEEVESAIAFLPAHAARLQGLDAYSHIIVLTYLDAAAAAPSQPESLRLASGRSYGIFATRSQLRPNHLGVSVVELLALEGATARVRGLDAIDGTPVLDVKPYLPAYDSRPGAHTP